MHKVRILNLPRTYRVGMKLGQATNTRFVNVQSWSKTTFTNSFCIYYIDWPLCNSICQFVIYFTQDEPIFCLFEFHYCSLKSIILLRSNKGSSGENVFKALNIIGQSASPLFSESLCSLAATGFTFSQASPDPCHHWQHECRWFLALSIGQPDLTKLVQIIWK